MNALVFWETVVGFCLVAWFAYFVARNVGGWLWYKLTTRGRK